ncbi:hypothetical protein HBH53_263400 [Parastagonospora nodorum]|nr:hypothetical protein HBH53_263400 [Parastagonospora nodorum]
MGNFFFGQISLAFGSTAIINEVRSGLKQFQLLDIGRSLLVIWIKNYAFSTEL